MADEDLLRLKIDKSGTAIKPKGHRKLFRWISVSLSIIFIGLLYFIGIFTPPVKVEVATVAQIYPSQTFTSLNASGYVVAQRKASLASKTTGRLEWLGVEEGDRVKSGQIIARLEGNDALAAKKQAEANLNNVRSSLDEAKAELDAAALNYNRYKELLSEELISKADYDAAYARYKKATAATAGAEFAIAAAMAALDAAEVAVEYTLIRAPFDAVVLTKNADVGDIITPLGAAANAKAAVVTIADMSSLQVEADVSESNLEKIRLRQPCEIQLDALPESRFIGEMHMIVPTADRTKASVMVKIKFLDRDNRILPEMSAKVAFLQRAVKPEEQKPHIAVNPESITDRNGKRSIFLVKENRALETPVTVGIRIGDMVEVLSGVSVGDRVVSRPSNKLRSGSKIRVAEK
ncbi:MAG: efflux RND transporter periplasmic adaptor subunit [Nitrospirae bacterium]|nr:efflux RND transporter periplasmic adaptor subunit [Nitrospirota bacterium]